MKKRFLFCHSMRLSKLISVGRVRQVFWSYKFKSRGYQIDRRVCVYVLDIKSDEFGH